VTVVPPADAGAAAAAGAAAGAGAGAAAGAAAGADTGADVPPISSTSTSYAVPLTVILYFFAMVFFLLVCSSEKFWSGFFKFARLFNMKSVNR
jgi:hypothetical protein